MEHPVFRLAQTIGSSLTHPLGRIGLVLLAEQIINCLDRIEGDERHFHENSIPVSHGPIPKPREFESLQFSAFLGFDGDERGVGSHKIPECKRSTQVIPNATNQIHGIEMGGGLPSCTLLS